MVMVASGDFIELLFFSSVAGFYASEHGCQRTWQCYLLQNNGAILFLSMRIDKVCVRTYALPFAYDSKKQCAEGLIGKAYSLCSTSRKMSYEKTPHDKLPLHRNESL